MKNPFLQKNQSNTIFVIDDDIFLNRLFCHFLQEKGFLTSSATSLDESIIAFKSGESVDLILLDYNLGDGTGLDFLSFLRNFCDDNIPPVIMVSTNEDPIFLEGCFEAGIADYLIKPVNLSLLALKVSTLIQSIALQRLISLQNIELARFKQEAEREESIAKFTYEYLLGQNTQEIDGVILWLKSSASFSGDVAIAKLSPSGDLYFLLADATGHGLSAAITILPVVSIFNTMVAKGFDVQPIVMEMNRKLVRDTPHDRFVAAIVVHIQQENNEIHIWNGGMPAAYWIKDGDVIQEFKSRHMALGILDDEDFDVSVETRRLSQGGIFLAVSDGLLEQMDADGNCFSKEKLLNVISNRPENIVAAVIEALASHASSELYSDDVSVCALIPSQIPSGGYCLLSEKNCHEELARETSEFTWSVRIAGKKLASCELPPLCNKFLQYVGVEKNFCQIIFLIISEMASNALDHGVLQLDSQLKEQPEGFSLYFQEREFRLAQLTNADAIELTLRWEITLSGPQMTVSMEDSGTGYNFLEAQCHRDDLLSGRGLRMIKNLSRHVEIFPPGNRIEAVISTN